MTDEDMPGGLHSVRGQTRVVAKRIMRWQIFFARIAVFATLWFPQPSFGESPQEMFDRCDKFSEYPHCRGPQFYQRLAPLAKSELLLGLTHSNIWIRENVLLILKKYHIAKLTRQDIKAICSSLEDSMFEVREAAIDLIGSHPDGKAYLEKKIGVASNNSAVGAAIGILKHPDGFTAEVRSRALRRLLDCVGGCDRESQIYLFNSSRPETLPWLRKMIANESLPEIATTQEAKTYAGIVAANRSVAELKQMLQTNRPQLKTTVLRELWKSSSDDALWAALKLVDESESEVRRAAFSILSQSSNPIVVGALIRGLRDSDDEVVMSAIMGIERLKAKEALPDLVTLVEGKNPTSPVLSRTQLVAGETVSHLTGRNFGIGLTEVCTHDSMESWTKIEAGKKKGGAEGKRLIAEGEREMSKINRDTGVFAAMARSKNIEGRRKLLEWWSTEASNYSP